MKSLKDFLKECGEGFATPMNTPGMGNPMAPTATEVGSEPLVPMHKLKKKKKNETNKKILNRTTKIE